MDHSTKEHPLRDKTISRAYLVDRIHGRTHGRSLPPTLLPSWKLRTP